MLKWWSICLEAQIEVQYPLWYKNHIGVRIISLCLQVVSLNLDYAVLVLFSSDYYWFWAVRGICYLSRSLWWGMIKSKTQYPRSRRLYISCKIEVLSCLVLSSTSLQASPSLNNCLYTLYHLFSPQMPDSGRKISLKIWRFWKNFSTLYYVINTS